MSEKRKYNRAYNTGEKTPGMSRITIGQQVKDEEFDQSENSDKIGSTISLCRSSLDDFAEMLLDCEMKLLHVTSSVQFRP